MSHKVPQKDDETLRGECCDQSEVLSTILKLSPDGFVSFDQNRCINYLSPAFTQMTGLGIAQLQGLDEAAFWGVLAGLQDEAMQVPAKPGALLELSRPVQRALDISQYLNPTGAVSKILCFRDVTHETEVDRFKTEFLSTAAHELRTPLASIYGFTELLLKQSFDTTTQNEFLRVIFAQSQQMSSLLNELLDLARIEARAGKDLTLVCISALDLVRQVVSSLQLPHGRSLPSITASTDELFLHVDSLKTQQAIGNVLSNAYKYSPAGGTVRIQIEASRSAADEPMVGIHISDPGIGMHPEQATHIFERFYRADRSGKIPGTGLGMSIVKELVELQRGSVTVSSVAGRGTTICLLLPAASNPDPPKGAA